MAMASQALFVLDDLKAKFRQFDEMATVAADLQHRLALIHQENAQYGGRDDPIARAYHRQIDQPTTDLGVLVTGMQQLLELTGEGGSGVADDFSRAHDGANLAASSW